MPALTLIRVDIDAFESLFQHTDIIHMSHFYYNLYMGGQNY